MKIPTTRIINGKPTVIRINPKYMNKTQTPIVRESEAAGLVLSRTEIPDIDAKKSRYQVKVHDVKYTLDKHGSIRRGPKLFDGKPYANKAERKALKRQKIARLNAQKAVA